MTLTNAQRSRLFDLLDQLPEPYGYELRANKDGSYSMVLGGKKGQTRGRLTMRTRGTIEALITDAAEYIRYLQSRGEIAA